VSPRKTITDTVHGTIGVEGVVLELLETLELQRLSGIRQLGPTYLVFPGANHSRLEHALGASHLADGAARALNLPQEEAELVTVAALLHDVGHGPFSHTLEAVLDESLGIDHMDFTKRIILGKEDNVRQEEREAMLKVPRIREVLEDHGVDPADVADLIRGVEDAGYDITAPDGRTAQAHFGGRRHLSQLIHSAVDVDQLDYLQRDAFYTGVVHGRIDFGRLLETMRVHNGQLVFDRKGVPAVEGLLVARALMYTSVYFHKTVRIAELMLARAVERSGADMLDVQRMVDAELTAWLMEQGGFQREMALRLKYRRLYKRAFVAGEEALGEERMGALGRLVDPRKRRAAEDAICRRAGVPEGSAMIDIPRPDALVTEPRMADTSVRVLDGGAVKPLRRYSPLARALSIRQISDWVVMVSARPEHREAIRGVAEKVIFE
jgi:HD superfamily phosphohydrolase